MSSRPLIGVQLYTLRDYVEKDMAGVLRRVAELGYEGVEIGGSFGNLDASTIKGLCDQLNLKVIAVHTGIDALQNNFDRVSEDALVLDAKYVVIAWTGEEYRNDEGAMKLAGILNEFGAKLNSSNIQLLYHNHDFEFVKLSNGEFMLDTVYANTDPKLVQIELDSFWVKKGGVDPAAYIRQYNGRVPLVHLKDMTNDEQQTFAEVGQGSMDWPSVFEAAEAGGVVAYIVEQDQCAGDPFESVRISIENLKKWGKLG